MLCNVVYERCAADIKENGFRFFSTAVSWNYSFALVRFLEAKALHRAPPTGPQLLIAQEKWEESDTITTAGETLAGSMLDSLCGCAARCCRLVINKVLVRLLVDYKKNSVLAREQQCAVHSTSCGYRQQAEFCITSSSLCGQRTHTVVQAP